jgi:radical SAM superfamily enzyme YgiQ (UPF0313 family)
MVDSSSSAVCQPRHPLGGAARVLLSGVFGPFARDDEYGSRAINPMELYHNQVTRVQGPFSLRMFNRSWGLMFLQANINAPCTLLDFPTLERFEEELREVRYDVVGIGGITIHLPKIKKMCELVRQHQPWAQIVVGGHATNIADLHERIDADHIVRGEGVRWLRAYLGEDQSRPFRHPVIRSRIGARVLGEPVPDNSRDVMATLIPSVGCPLGCNFCITSSMFGGKGKYFTFFQTGEELFEIMRQLEAEIGARAFFVMDENFLLDRRRALCLLDLMERHDKAWTLYAFSSANAISSYSIDELVRLGVSWLWLGIEGEDGNYGKLKGIDSLELVHRLRSNGIRVLGSTIIGLEDHTPDNIDKIIERAVRHQTDFHQFMLYMALPGTPLEAQLIGEGRMLDEEQSPHFDRHGQYRFSHRHRHIPAGKESEYLLQAFRRDFEENGPSMLRTVRTALNGYQRYSDSPDPRVRRRIQAEMKSYAMVYVSAVSAARRFYRDDPHVKAQMTSLLDDLVTTFGRRARIYAALGGKHVLGSIRKEQRRLDEGWTYEPPTFYDANEAALSLPHLAPGPQLAGWVEPIAAEAGAVCGS